MPTFRFKGFVTGSAVAISAAIGPALGSASVSEWAVPASSTGVSFSVAPEGATAFGCIYEAHRFKVQSVTGITLSSGPYDSYIPMHHEIEWAWLLVPPAGGEPTTFSSVTRLAPGHNDRLTFFGPDNFIVPRTPGTWTIHVFGISQSGETVTGSTTFEVLDITDIVPDVQTWLLHDGDLTGAPVHDASREYTTWDQVVSALDAIPAGTKVRVQAKGGTTFTQTSRLNMRFHDWDGLIVHRYGTGNAVISCTDEFIKDVEVDSDAPIILHGVDIVGQWDGATEGPGDYGTDYVVNGITTDGPRGSTRSFTFSALTIRGFGQIAYNQNTMLHIWFEDVRAYDQRDMNLFSAGHFYLSGCNFDDSPLAVAGGHKFDSYDGKMRNSHGGTRGSGLKICNCSQMFSQTGWSITSSGQWVASQLSVRFNPEPFIAAKGNFQRSVFESTGIGAGSTSEENTGPVDALFERCILLGTHQEIKFETSLSGLTFRNSFVIQTSAARSPGGSDSLNIVLNRMSVEAAAGAASYGTPFRPNTDPVRIVANAMITHQPGSGSFDPFVILEAFPDQRVANNLLYAPNFSPAYQPDGALVAQAGTTPISLGARMGNTHHLITLASTLNPGDSAPEIPWFNDYDDVAVDHMTFSGGGGKHLLKERGGNYGSSYWHTGTPGDGVEGQDGQGGLDFDIQPTGVTLTLLGTALTPIPAGEYWLKLDRSHNLSGFYPGTATPATDGQLWAPSAPVAPDDPDEMPRMDFFGKLRSQDSPTKGPIDANATDIVWPA